ncbi:MAG: MBL fold metallo-hydrolase [Dehalococcoidia bacterium]|jgi:glyoxylase-like metal-dependent hydrolase (beta-lactamase superfamily II)|nr:MBL fold metallo-hydrolase [Dehalococcoidia bacterium]
MPQIYSDDDVTIELLPALGRMANNSYILRAADGGGIAVVDVPEGFEAVLEALGDDAARVTHVLVTHSHFDHWGGYDVMRGTIAAPVFAGAEETNLDESRDIQSLTDGDEVAVGGAVVRVLHTPGHTPGSVSLVTGGAVLTGDTLFPGGPGHSRTNEALQQEIVSITTWLHTLPDGTLVLPGHGDTTTVGESKAEYEVFAGKDHDPDLHGDVLWLES